MHYCYHCKELTNWTAHCDKCGGDHVRDLLTALISLYEAVPIHDDPNCDCELCIAVDSVEVLLGIKNKKEKGEQT